MGKERRAVNPERIRRQFSKEFKVEAVRLLERGEKPATRLGIKGLKGARLELILGTYELQHRMIDEFRLHRLIDTSKTASFVTAAKSI